MTDFQYVPNRKLTKSVKWDQLKMVFNTDDVLPMWVADMDFKAPDEVNQILKERAEHGIYGYTIIDDQIKSNVVRWLQTKHHWSIDSKHLAFSPGVITSLHTAIQTFTEQNDKILIQTPVYTPFFHLIKGGNREIIENPLIKTEDSYEIDFDDLESNLKQGVKAFILCSPHNPVGRAWTKEELIKIADLCLRHHVLIFSDEIHADLVFPGHKHTPIASISEEIAQQTITCMSPTKTFNLAGLQASYMVIQNKRLLSKVKFQLGLQGFNTLNTFGTLGLHAAYEYGRPWLDELIHYLNENKNFATKALVDETNQRIKVTKSEATYLLWLDCKELELDDKSLQQFMIEKAKVGLNAGSSYGKQGEQFMRLNFACPRGTLEEGIDRITSAINAL